MTERNEGNRERAKALCDQLYYDVDGLIAGSDKPMAHDDNLDAAEKALDEAEARGWEKAIEADAQDCDQILRGLPVGTAEYEATEAIRNRILKRKVDGR